MSLWHLLLIVCTLIGAITGAMAKKIQGGTSSLGKTANVVIGIVGGWLGAFLGVYLPFLVFPEYAEGVFNPVAVRIVLVGSIAGPIIGALALVWIAGKLTRGNEAMLN
jgi:uncharacterized membrane protein YeaQ/YmgE (transglycosylase-associated protein family)